MVFKSEYVVWKLKEGISVPFGGDASIKKDGTLNIQAIENKSQPSASLGETDKNRSQEPHEDRSPVAGIAQESTIAREDNNQQSQKPASEYSVPKQQTEDNKSVIDEVHQKEATSTFVPQNTLQQQNAMSPKTETENKEASSGISPRDRGYLFNPSTATPVVDGVPLITGSASASNHAGWMRLPYRLRPHRADVFIDSATSVDFKEPLVSYLKSKGLKVLEYDDTVRYLPSDILLLDKDTIIDAGTVYVLQQGKRYIFNALKYEFGARLK